MRGLVLAMALAGCVESSAKVCGDGSICPRGYECDDENNRCLRPEQTAACTGAGLVDGQDCSVDELPGTCEKGACELWFCGDGKRQGFESCDGDDFGTDEERGVPVDCVTLGYYEAPGLACTANCTFEPKGCTGGRCGDGAVNGTEVCDGDTTSTCVAIGFDAGGVSCDDLCAFTIINCSRFGWNAESLTDIVGLAVSGTAHNDQWVVGEDGKAAHFDGVFWVPFPTGVTQTLNGVWSISRRDVWAIGHTSTVIRYTEDANGENRAWAVVTGAPAGDYVDIWAPDAAGGSDPNTGAVYIATSDVGILHFDGASWSTLPALTGTPIAIRGTSDTDIWVATSEGPLQHYNGTTWTALTPPATAVKFLDANAADDVWVIGHQTGDPGTGVIAHFDGNTAAPNGGWTTFVRAGEIYNNIASSAPNDAWVAGADGLMRHFDGVAFSNSSNISLPGGVTGISGFLSFGPQELVAVSTLRLAYRYRGQTFGQFKTLGADPFSAPANLAFWSNAANDVWMTNLSRQVFHFDGLAWNLETTFASPSKAVFGFGANDVWFGVENGTVVHYTGTFAAPEVVTGTAISHIFGSGNDVWAFSVGSAFHRNAQDNWTAFPLAVNQPVQSVSGSGANDIWAVVDGAIPKLFHWNGTMWAEDTTISSPTRMLAVAAVSPTDVHVTAEDGGMLHWDGSTWSLTQVASVGQVRVIAATANDDVIAASALDAFHYDGRQWSPLRLPDEIRSPGMPTIRGIQATPGRVDLLLERFKIMTLIRTRPLVCRGSELIGPGSCNDGVDNDCDGKVDSNDSECP